MKKIILFCISICCGISFSYAQPSISWQKTVGGSNHEYAWKTIKTSDGGLAFVGFSESSDGDVSGNHGGVDLWVGKINAAGNIVWSFLYGGTQDDQGYDILQTSDGGYMVTGWTDSNDGDVSGNHSSGSSDLWVLKLNPSGAITWQKCYGGSSDDDGIAIAQTLDGNFYVAGTTYSTNGDVSGDHNSADIWVIKIGPTGTLLGQKCIGGTNYEEGYGMVLTSDGGCIVCGRTSSSDGDAVGYHGGSDMLIAKLNSSLSIDWSKCYGGTETEECNAIVQLSDGSYAALGYTSTHNNGDVTGHHGSQGSDDFWLLKLTSAGAITWAKCYGGSGDDQANGLTKTSDGGFVVSGLTNSTDGDVTGFHAAMFDPDIWVAKINGSGTLLWQKCCGGSGQDESFNVIEFNPTTYVVTGFTYSNDFDVSGNHGNADGWIFKISGSSSIDENAGNNLVSVFPNPAKDNIAIKSVKGARLDILNLQGQLVKSIPYTEETNRLDISDVPGGVYTLLIRTNLGISAWKLIKN